MNDLNLTIEKLTEEFKKRNIKDVSVENFQKSCVELYNVYKNIYNPTDILNMEQSDLINKILDFYNEKTDNLKISINEKRKNLKNHSFFKNKPYVCSAPWTSLRFEFGGKMTVCCVNDYYSLGSYPQTKPIDAWFGDNLKILRDSLMNFDFSKGCQICENSILNNTENISVIALQEELGLGKDVNKPFPSQLIFQLHNTCNFECIMCGGRYSSSIRKNREGLPSFLNVYDQNFLDDILIFIKNARIIEFIGGEPFLIPIYYDLMELIAENNPNCKVDIISNGSIYNSKVENILKKLLNVEVHVSLDSVNEKTFSFIRKNGDLNVVLTNIQKFKNINKMGSIAICPMIPNIYEIHDILNFCKEIPTNVWFNTVESTLGLVMYEDIYENGHSKRPENSNPLKTCTKIPEFRLRFLSKEEKFNVIKYLSKEKHPFEYQQKINALIEYISHTM